MSPNDPVYHNVFKVANHCSFGNENIAQGQEFYFQLTSKNDKDCVICMLWDNPPATQQKIVVVSK